MTQGGGDGQVSKAGTDIVHHRSRNVGNDDPIPQVDVVRLALLDLRFPLEGVHVVVEPNGEDAGSLAVGPVLAPPGVRLALFAFHGLHLGRYRKLRKKEQRT